MSNTPPSPGVDPEIDSQAEDTTTDASAQPPKVNAEDYTAEELLEALTEEPKAKAPLQTQHADTSAQPKPADDVAEGKGQPSKKENLRLRFSALSPEQQAETAEAYRMVREGEAKDMLEAYQSLRGVQANPDVSAHSEADLEQDVSKTAPTSEIDTLTAQIADLRAKRKQAKVDYAVEEEEDLTTQIEDMTIQLAKAQAKAEAIAEFAQRNDAQTKKSWDQEYDAAVDELEAQYPDVIDDNSPFTRLLDAKIKAAKSDADARLRDPRFILQFADELAEEIKAFAPKPSGLKPSPPPSVPRPTGSAVAPSQNIGQRVSDQQAAAIFYDENTHAEDILNALFHKSR